MKTFNLKAYISELIGTFLLTFIGCATACIVGTKIDGGYLIVALSFGLVLMTCCYIFGPISGCHINPAVTIAMFINKKINIIDAVIYIISQIIGGIAAGGLLSYFFKEQYGLGSNIRCKSYDLEFSIIIEIILTFVFILAIFGATSKKENTSVTGLVIGGSLSLVHIVGIFFTGTSVNPARSIGPALFAKGAYLSDLWIFILAPIVGAIAAALLWKFISDKK